MPRAHILVVDDDRWVRQTLRDLLAPADCAVTEAGDGGTALAQAAALQPDVILLDLMMPGLDGYTVCHRLQANPATRTIPVIVLTASLDRSLNRRAYAAGAVACLTKPFRREALLAVIRTALQGVAHRGKRDEGERP